MLNNRLTAPVTALILPFMVIGLILISADTASAKRFGSGKSFGSKPAFGKTYDKPLQPAQPAQSQTIQPQRRGLFGNGGGMFGTLLAGSFIGAMLFGGHHAGLGAIDIFIIVMLIMVLFRLLRSQRRGNQPPDESRSQNDQQYSNRHQGGTDEKPRVRPEDFRPNAFRPDAFRNDSHPENQQTGNTESKQHENHNFVDQHESTDQRLQRQAQSAWDYLRSEPENGPRDQHHRMPQETSHHGTRTWGGQQDNAAGTVIGNRTTDITERKGGPESGEIPADFDVADFLKGAKMVFARLQHSWDARDMEDIRHFTTPVVFDEIRRQAGSDPTPSSTEIMTINARLLEVKEEEEGTLATVYFDVLLRENTASSQTEEVKEIWHFHREHTAEANWLLDGIQQVDQT